MDHFAGLDVSVKETSICIVDDAGKIVREVKVASEPEALLAVLKNLAYHREASTSTMMPNLTSMR
jgi:transposase